MGVRVFRAVVVRLRAMESGRLTGATGRAVHGLWFRRWQETAPAVADALHQAGSVAPFTLSPLLGLPRPRRGQVEVAEGQSAWFRITTLEGSLGRALQDSWLAGLAGPLELAGIPWQANGWAATSQEHDWAGQVDPQQLAETRLLNPTPPDSWRLLFFTPTAFHGPGGHLPFPLPESLVNSWLRRWRAFGSVQLPDHLVDVARERLLMSAYTLKTVPVRHGERVVVGCVGQLAVRAVGLRPGECAALDLLAACSFYTGSGHHTPQGMGMTRLLD
jgi:CRISPR-associated endoribonuclease Cas6